MVKLIDIAKELNFSVSTVSYALNNDHRIPLETRELIQNKGKEMGYVGRAGQTHNRNSEMKQIVVCFYSINGDLYTEVFNAIHHILHISNCKTLIYCGNKVDNIDWIDGLICLNAKIDKKQIETLTYRKVPVILLDREDKIPYVSNVVIDNYNGSYALVKRFIEKGCKKFIYVSGPLNNTDALLRQKGFIDCLKDNNLYSSDIITYRGDFTKQSGINIANNILSLNLKSDAIICANDEMAEGVMDVLIERGLKIGKDIYVGGFDGIANKKYLGFITCSYNISNRGSLAAYTLLRLFENNNDTTIKIPVEIIEF